MATLTIKKNNISHNLDQIREVLNYNTKIMAMVKANSYGLGSVEISKYLESKGVDFFGVAYVKEAIELRENGINSNILVTSPFLEDDIQNIIDNNICVSVSDLVNLEKLNKYAITRNKKVKIHIKIETGMSRLGFNLEHLEENLKIIKTYSAIVIDGIYTHLSSADSDKDYTINQINKFKQAIKIANFLNIAPTYIHALSSAGIVNFPEYQFNMVRAGDILYGYHPDSEIRSKIDIKPCAKLTAKILHISNYEEGTKISYNGTCTLNRDSKVATVQMGYADGLFRALSNKYEVKVNDKKCKILGNICMDMFMCDITDAGNVKLFDEVTILDYNEDIYKMAEILNTIDYEILSKLSSRVERKYL